MNMTPAIGTGPNRLSINIWGMFNDLTDFAVLSLNAREDQGLLILTMVLFFFFPLHHLNVFLAPLSSTVNIWWMSEQMNKWVNKSWISHFAFMDMPWYNSKKKDKKMEKEKGESHHCSFPAPSSSPSLPAPIPTPTLSSSSIQKILNQSMLWGNENEAFGLGIFILICALAKDKREVGKQTMQEAVGKKIIIVGESKVLSDSTDYGWTNAEQLFSRGFMWTTIWRRRPKLFCCLTH